MKLTQATKTAGAALSLVAMSLLGTGVASAAPITFVNEAGIKGDYLGKDCVATYCVDLASAGYSIDGGGVVDFSKNNVHKTPGADSSDPTRTLSYNVTSTLNDPTGSTNPIDIFDLSGSFEFYWGSVDGYNKVEFFADDKLLLEITGTTLAAVLPGFTVAKGNYNLDAYVSFVGDFDRVKLSSTGVAFELATAVPEPGTLALLGLGLMGIGFARRRASA